MEDSNGCVSRVDDTRAQPIGDWQGFPEKARTARGALAASSEVTLAS